MYGPAQSAQGSPKKVARNALGAAIRRKAGRRRREQQDPPHRSGHFLRRRERRKNSNGREGPNPHSPLHPANPSPYPYVGILGEQCIRIKQMTLGSPTNTCVPVPIDRNGTASQKPSPWMIQHSD